MLSRRKTLQSLADPRYWFPVSALSELRPGKLDRHSFEIVKGGVYRSDGVEVDHLRILSTDFWGFIGIEVRFDPWIIFLT